MKRKIFAGLMLTAIATGGFASESDGIFTYRVGRFEVNMLVEREGDGNTTIIPSASQDVLNRYIPASGFKSSTNAFLIKAPGQNILVDTAFGGPAYEKMKKLGVEPEQVDAVLITHLHGDHFAGLVRNGAALLPRAKIYLAVREHEHFTKTQPNQGAMAALTPYGSNVITFEPSALGGPNRELFPGITPIANYGHTPGHTVFLIEDGGTRLIIAGDFLHIAPVQFPVPGISATYDMDQAAAAASRRQLMDYAAKNKVLLGGMHIAYPGIGSVEADGNGYRFIPLR
ncbi:MAG: MBL fold metallo-hydrolase [Treponema sp.]|jgi:glyoxylase-like metal-dependent hydrolase (beta-lactamase superfamily II)|nr:MBL fold metallo-hydrolase [Treponema sp.]